MESRNLLSLKVNIAFYELLSRSLSLLKLVSSPPLDTLSYSWLRDEPKGGDALVTPWKWLDGVDSVIKDSIVPGAVANCQIRAVLIREPSYRTPVDKASPPPAYLAFGIGCQVYGFVGKNGPIRYKREFIS